MKAKYLFFLVSVLFGCFFYSCELDPDFVVGEVPTISNLTISSPANLSCDLPCNNTFTATSLLTSPTNTGDEVSYTWDFGDGTTEVIGNNITHEYTTAGEYDITLTASAPDATDISINPKFVVDPNGTFINTTETGLIGMDVVEISDGYIVFGLYSLIKYDKEGNLIKTIDVRNFIDNYFYGDNHQLSEDNFLLIAHDDGMRATIDNNLNFFNLTAGFYGTGARIAAVAEVNGGLIQLGTSNGQYGGDGFYGAAPLIPSGGPQAFAGDPNYWLDYYTGWAGNEPIPGIRPPKHLELDNEFYIPVTSLADGEQIYGFNGGYKYYDNLSLNTIKSVTDGQDNNMLLLGNDDNNLVLLEVDKTSGATGTKTVLCDEGSPGLPQGLTTTTDGYIIVTRTNSFWNCISEFTLDNNIVIRITKLDFQYNTVWDKIIDIENSSAQIEMIKEADNGGFLLTGTLSTLTGDQLLFIKTDSEGVVIP